MTVVKGVGRGEVQDIALSKEEASRLLIGLGWDAKQPPRMRIVPPKAPQTFADWLALPFLLIKTTFLSLVRVISMGFYFSNANKEDAKGRDKDSDTYDLDLDCYIFDKDMNLKFVVGTEDANLIDASKKVYHSGENQTGMGGPDDEQVFIELQGLPEDYNHFFLVVKSDSKSSFEEVSSPRIRLADSRSNVNLLENLIDPPAHYNAYGYVFCHISRDGTAWKVRNLDEYAGDIADWPAFIGTLKK